MARLVLIDASPLIGLARIDGLPWLGALFGEVAMPLEVRGEVLVTRFWAPADTDPGRHDRPLEHHFEVSPEAAAGEEKHHRLRSEYRPRDHRCLFLSFLP